MSKNIWSKFLFILLIFIVSNSVFATEKYLDLFAKDSTIKVSIVVKSSFNSYLPIRLKNFKSTNVYFYYNSVNIKDKNNIKEILLNFSDTLDNSILKNFSKYKKIKLKNLLGISLYENKIKKTISNKNQSRREVSNVVGLIGLGVLALPITTYYTKEGQKNRAVALNPPARVFDVSNGHFNIRAKDEILKEITNKAAEKQKRKKLITHKVKIVVSIAIITSFVYTLYSVFFSE